MRCLPYCSIALLFFIVLFSQACKKNSTDPVNEEQVTTQKLTNLEAGPAVALSSATLAASGGTIKISRVDSPVDGIEISVPANSFSTSQTFKVSSSEIKNHQLGPNFNPISPLITIACDGGYASELMSVTIPVKIPAGHIPLGFYFDPSTGKLEGIPFKSITPNSITLLTRHFLASSQLKSGNTSLKSGSAGSNIIISSIAESVLNGQPIIASGFKPGVDDWEFVNNGSYISSTGHCSGQTLGAMWYYFEKKALEGSLFNKFKGNPGIWQNNANGYKFCSVLQEDLNWDGTVAKFFYNYIDKNQELDKLKLLTIAGAIMVTGEPQAISIWRLTGALNADGTPKYAGHAIICYQVSVSSGKLYISDPNTPGTGQTIDFTNNKFSPYLAKLNGTDASKLYPFIAWYAKTAVVDWPAIAKRWGEMVNNTIGTIAPNTFPAYTIWDISGAVNELKDGSTVNKDTLQIMVNLPVSTIFFPAASLKLTGCYVYDQTGVRIDKQEGLSVAEVSAKSHSYVILKPGVNKLAYYIVGWKEEAKLDNGSYKDLFIDFKWINVTYIPLTIDPSPLNGEPSKEYTLTAKSKGAAPKTSKYIWDFGDGGAVVAVQNDSTIKHTFTKAGNYPIKVELYNTTGNAKVAEATGIAKISSNAGSGTFSYDGRTYAYKTIGIQTWMVENLAYLPSVSLGSTVSKTSPLYYVYGYQGTDITAAKAKANYATYGVLYNGPAALKSCPSGWHLPTNMEWQTLLDYLGTSAGGKMKETGTAHWSGSNIGATNSSGFNALAGGLIPGTSGGFESLGLNAVFWSASDNGLTNTLGLVLEYSSGSASWWQVFNTADAFSVRCIKD